MKSKISSIHFQSSGALHGFGNAEMPPAIFGGKGEAKDRPQKAGGVNNHWNTRNQRFLVFSRTLKHCSLRCCKGSCGSICIDAIC